MVKSVTSSHGLDMVNLENPAGLRFLKLGCKQHWWGLIQRGVRSKMIIVLPPSFDLCAGVSE